MKAKQSQSAGTVAAKVAQCGLIIKAKFGANWRPQYQQWVLPSTLIGKSKY